MAYEGLTGNLNAQKWTEERISEVFNHALSISKDKDLYAVKDGTLEGYKYHFLGEIASEMDLYSDIFKYLRDLNPEAEMLYNRLKTRLEANCFSDSKKGIIKEATAIMNLKSNYGWTDRVENKTELNAKVEQVKPPIEWVDSNEATE